MLKLIGVVIAANLLVGNLKLAEKEMRKRVVSEANCLPCWH